METNLLDVNRCIEISLASVGSIEQHNPWLVSKIFSQVEGVDYNETFSLIAKMNSIHLVLALAASHKWEVHWMDVKSTFLHYKENTL
jgi:hypothetical protein